MSGEVVFGQLTISLGDIYSYIGYVQMYDGNQQPYCVGCEYHENVDIRTLPPLNRRTSALSRVADLDVCEYHGQWEAGAAMVLYAKTGQTLHGLAAEYRGDDDEDED